MDRMIRLAFGLLCIHSTICQLAVNSELPIKESYFELYETSLKHYKAKHFDLTAYYTELAIADKRYRDAMLVKCHSRCSRSTLSESNHVYFLSLVNAEKCTRKCMKNIFGEPLQLPLWVIKDFKSREPYSFLQYSYYKTERLAAALEAARVHLKYNPDSDMMQKNVRYYSSVAEDISLPHEQLDSSETFKLGMQKYSGGEYSISTHLFNLSLSLYMTEIGRCKTLCETGFDQYINRKIPNLEDTNTFYEQFVKLYHTVMECRYKCVYKFDKKIESTEDYLPRLLNYLQFSAYQNGDKAYAAQIARAYLHIKPGDQTMTNNLNIFLRTLGKSPDDLTHLHAFVDQNSLDMEVLSAIVGKKEMRKRLKDKQKYVLGDMGLVSDLKPNSQILWTNSY